MPDLLPNTPSPTVNPNLSVSPVPPVPTTEPPLNEEIITVGTTGSASKTKAVQKTLLVLSILLLLTAIPGGVFLVNQNQKIQKQAAVIPPDDGGGGGGGGQPAGGVCYEGKSFCKESQSCNVSDGQLKTEALWDDCGEEPPPADGPYIGKYIGLSPTSRGCSNGIHTLDLDIVKSERYLSSEMKIYSWTTVCTCNEACGKTVDAQPNHCVCGQNTGGSCQTRKETIVIKANDSTAHVRREATLPNNGCGSAQIDFSVNYIEVGGDKCGSEEGLSLLTNWNGAENTSAFTIWYSGKAVSECQPVLSPTPTPTGLLTPTPTPTQPATSSQCTWIKVYDNSESWKEIRRLCLTDPENSLNCKTLGQLKAGDLVRIAVKGSSAACTDGRFQINSGGWKEKSGIRGEEFYYNYLIPVGVTNFNFEAQVKCDGRWK